ncbi:MAG TPA: hypothetical protein VML00_01035 [Bacteroidota bacterium]|nr:hypothetical protein [Bacteroidota bacterium]
MGSGHHSEVRRLAAGLALIAGVAAGCDESLPPRLADPNAIAVSVKMGGGQVTVTNGVVGGNGGGIEASVSNIYTEVLQDTAAVNIRCRIWLASVPDSPGVAVIGASELVTPGLMRGGMLTILPHQTALFDKRWDFTTTGGTPFWKLIPLKDTSDRQGPFKLSDPVEVLMWDTVRIFTPVPDYVLGPASAVIQFEVR